MPEDRPEIRIVDQPDRDAILDWLRTLRLKAYARGSGYKVAAVAAVKRKNDYVLVGAVNVECLDHRHGTHGESSAISAVATLFGKAARIDEIWTIGAPGHLTVPCADPLADLPGFCCGDCRQHINEIARHPDIPVHSFSLNGAVHSKTLRQILPDSFSFAHISPQPAAARTDVPDKTVKEADLETLTRRMVRAGPRTQAEMFQWLSSLESIDEASRVHQAVAILLDNRAAVAGVKAENAAYVGLSAVQGVVGNAVATFGPQGVRVREIFTLSVPRDHPRTDVVYPLPLSGLQTLFEFVDGDPEKIPVTMFAADGAAVTVSLSDAAVLPTTFAAPAYPIDNGRIIKDRSAR